MSKRKEGRKSSRSLRSCLTCVSVSISEVATSKRFGLDRYLLSLNWFSNSSSCWLVKAVLGLRHFPNKPAWAAAWEGKTQRQNSSRKRVTGLCHLFHLFMSERNTTIMNREPLKMDENFWEMLSSLNFSSFTLSSFGFQRPTCLPARIC